MVRPCITTGRTGEVPETEIARGIDFCQRSSNGQWQHVSCQTIWPEKAGMPNPDRGSRRNDKEPAVSRPSGRYESCCHPTTPTANSCKERWKVKPKGLAAEWVGLRRVCRRSIWNQQVLLSALWEIRGTPKSPWSGTSSSQCLACWEGRSVFLDGKGGCLGVDFRVGADLPASFTLPHVANCSGGSVRHGLLGLSDNWGWYYRVACGRGRRVMS